MNGLGSAGISTNSHFFGHFYGIDCYLGWQQCLSSPYLFLQHEQLTKMYQHFFQMNVAFACSMGAGLISMNMETGSNLLCHDLVTSQQWGICRALFRSADKMAKARGECRCAPAVHAMGWRLACIPPGQRFAAHTVPQEGQEPGIRSQRLVA